MVPKIIHYCWFGRKPLPNSAQKCIQSWKTYFPGYEIKQWNEDNYDVNRILYIQEAYKAGKYAFVSDYARFDILYQYGGIYFDTDVEVIKSFEDVLKNGAFMGCESNEVNISGKEGESKKNIINVNPGLGMAAGQGLAIFKEILDYYYGEKFFKADGSFDTTTVVIRITKILQKYGLKNINGIQKVQGIVIYPKEYFNPLNCNTGELNMTDNTHSIHWYSMSWLSPLGRLRCKMMRPIHKMFGEDIKENLLK